MQDELIVKQVEVLLEMQTKRLQSEIASLQNELSRVRTDLRGLREVRREDRPASPPKPVEEPTAKPVTGPAEFQPSPTGGPIDRNGVAPEDVSIEKIFYSGGR